MPNHPKRSRRQTLLRQLNKQLVHTQDVATRWAPGTSQHTRAINNIRVLERKIAATEAEGIPANWDRYEAKTPRPE